LILKLKETKYSSTKYNLTKLSRNCKRNYKPHQPT